MPNNLQKRKKSFRFSNFVSDKEEFHEIVKNCWNIDHNGCQMFKSTRKLKALKKPLKRLAWKNGDLFDKVKSLRDKLKDVQNRIDIDPHNKLLREEESLILRNYGEAMKEEEKLLFQKSKIKWLSMGDRNNAFFHRTLKSRYSRNNINVIHDEGGSRFEGEQDYDNLVKKKLCKVDADFMVRDVSNSEIRKAMFMIGDNKAPGPDGYSSHFFKKAWNILGDDVCKAVREFFDNGNFLSEINTTIIALIPKIQTPAKVSDYRPIACCNVIYKCISKVITERIKKYLGKLEDVLKGFGFHMKMVQWIMKCVTSTSFSIAINGENCGFFKGGRGLRQGDPMSPYLFTLVMEILNLLMIRKVKNNELFQYHFGCKQLKITHVCFADDLLMFCHGDSDSVRIIKEVIDEFSGVSGLLPNCNKSTIIFGSVSEEDR
ncbi:RNA-directed DNA polymerase, eukaryota, reverse transcriptase zinc-binding domain protein, partial [Tanacetum coccineum]